MADNVLFEVDASQIIAKLHLAGLQVIELLANQFIVNTGIKNDDPNAKPDNPGKVKFDLKNTFGEYQVGFVMPIEYHKTYKLETMLNDIAEIRSKLTGDKSKIFDELKANKELQDSFDMLKKNINAICKAKGIDEITDEQFVDPEQMKDIKKNIIEKVGESDKKAYDDVINKAKGLAVKKLNDYMLAFAGKDNLTSKIDNTSVGMMYISDAMKDSNSKGLVEMFEIQPISDQEKAKLTAQFQANFIRDPSEKNLNCKQKVCFYVKYELNVDK